MIAALIVRYMLRFTPTMLYIHWLYSMNIKVQYRDVHMCYSLCSITIVQNCMFSMHT